MSNLQKISDYLTETGMFFLATEDGSQPKCRPLGFQRIIDGQLYFGVGDFKDVYKQLVANPQVEIVASKQQDWLRVYGKAVFEKDDTLSKKIVAEAPFLQSIYNDETGYKLAVFHLENATAEFRSMMKVEESFTF